MTSGELKSWFENMHMVLETAYLSHREPWRQSGMSGPEDRWTALRKPVADCMEYDGSLDIGCANGYLIECCLRWAFIGGKLYRGSFESRSGYFAGKPSDPPDLGAIGGLGF